MPNLKTEDYKNLNMPQLMFSACNGLGNLSDRFQPELSAEYGSTYGEIQMMGERLPKTVLSSNGKVKQAMIYTDEAIDKASKVVAKYKKLLDDQIENPDEHLKDYVPFLKAYSLMLDPSWNYSQFVGESHYYHFGNIYTGCPKFFSMSPEELKKGLGKAYEPLNALYEASYDMLLIEKDKQLGKVKTPEEIKKYTDKKIEILDKMTAAYDQLYNGLTPEDRKRLNSTYLENEIDHLLGKTTDYDRSPLTDIEGMKAESEALKKGYSLDEAQVFYTLGVIKGKFKYESYRLNAEIERSQKALEDAKKKGIEPLSAEDYQKYNNIKAKNSPSDEEKNFIRSNSARHKITSMQVNLKEYKSDLEKRKHAFNSMEDLQNKLKKYDPKDFDQKVKAFNMIDKYNEGHISRPITAGQTYGKVWNDYKYATEKAYQTLAEQKKQVEFDKAKAEYESPEGAKQAFTDAVYNAQKYKLPVVKEQIGKELENIKLPEKYEDFISENFKQVINDTAGKVSAYPKNLELLKNAEKNILESKGSVSPDKDNYTRDTLDMVTTGRKIGWFGKEDYKNIQTMLREFLANKNERETLMTDARSFDKPYTHRRENGQIERRSVLDQKVIDDEKAILDAMDRYLDRKNREITRDGARANRNSVRRRDMMARAKKTFLKQHNLDKQLLEDKQKLIDAADSVKEFEADRPEKNDPVAKKNELAAQKSQSFNKFDAKLKTLDNEMKTMLQNDNGSKESRKGICKNACSNLYVNTMKEIFREKILRNPNKDWNKEIDKALSDNNIHDGAKNISNKMVAVDQFRFKFTQNIIQKGKNEGRIDYGIMRNTLDTMLSDANKLIAEQKQTNPQNQHALKATAEKLDDIAVASGSNVFSKQFEPRVQRNLNNNISHNYVL